MRWLIAVLLLTTACQDGAGDGTSSAASAALASAEAARVASIREVSMKDVLAMQKAGKVVIVDCNDRDSRVEQGTVAGATLLKKPPHIGDELPSNLDTPLVFYCWDHT